MKSSSTEPRARDGATHCSRLIASAFEYPSDVVDNDEYVRRCRFTPTTGWEELADASKMRTRRWCLPSENTRTMTERAIARLVEQDPSLAAQVDLVVVASGTTMTMAHPTDPDNVAFADLSPLVLRQLGRNDALGLDIKACYCTGFLRGLQTVDALLANPNYRVALLIATEQGSRFATAASNRTSFCYIVGDAAGVVALRRDTSDVAAGVVDYCGHTEVDKLEWVGIGPDAASIVMLGSRAASATSEMLVACGNRLLRRNGLTPRDVDWLLPIQSHFGLIDSVRQQLEFSSEQLLWFGDVNGFSGSASIPACLAEQRAAGRLEPGQLVLSLAVGAGMNCAGALYYV